MELLPTLREMFDHNYWARDRQIEAGAPLSQEQFTRLLGGSFPSLRETFAHLVAVEWIWLERWRGRNPRALIPMDDFPTLEAVRERWAEVEREMRSYLDGLDEEALAKPRTIVSTRGEQWTYPLWQMITHLLNHQAYHRGQITNMLRMLGAAPPRIDFLVGEDVGFCR